CLMVAVSRRLLAASPTRRSSDLTGTWTNTRWRPGLPPTKGKSWSWCSDRSKTTRRSKCAPAAPAGAIIQTWNARTAARDGFACAGAERKRRGESVKRAIVLLLLLSLGLAGPVQAQEEVERLEQLVVDIWPDYDRAAVLILLTGRLPAATSLPAMVTIPV